MGAISLEYVISYSSQDKLCKVDNLLSHPGAGKPWLCAPDDKTGRLEAEFQLAKASYIDFIDIGNCGSSTVEIQVGRSSFQNRTNYVSFLPAMTLMSLADIKEGVDRNAVYMFNRSNVNKVASSETWDRIKVICCQPFKKQAQFGLAFLLLRSRESSSHLNINNEPSFVASEERTLNRQSDKGSPLRNDRLFFTRGRRLLNASKSRHSSSTPQHHHNEGLSPGFEEDISIFLIACLEDTENKSLEDYLKEFEEQRRQKLSAPERHIFRNKYLDIFHGNHITSEFDSNNSFARRQSSSSVSSPSASGNPIRYNGSSTFEGPVHSTNKDIVLFDSERKPEVPTFDLTLATPNKRKSSSLSSNRRSYSAREDSVKRSDIPVFDLTSDIPVKRKCGDRNSDLKSKNVRRRLRSPAAHSTATELLNVRPEDFIQFDGIEPSTSSGMTFVDCPICSEAFLPKEIEKHASTCGDLTVVSREGTSCPLCGELYPESDLSSHVDTCIDRFD